MAVWIVPSAMAATNTLQLLNLTVTHKKCLKNNSGVLHLVYKIL